jgi:alpha-beta hydrolase superfamily lysophospholipase
MHPPLTPPAFHTWRLSDGARVRGRVWPGGQDVRPARCSEAFLYLHGIQSHGGWFERSASMLAAGGRMVVLPDRRGSGLNREQRGDTASAQRWLKDIDEVTEWVLTQTGLARVSLVAVSWGGKLAASWALRRPQRVERLLLIAPGLYPAVGVGAMRRLRIVATLLGGGRSMHPIPLSDPALFTDNRAGQAFIGQDPLKLTHATARFFYHSLRLDMRLRRLAAGSLQMPVTMLLASHDRIIRNEPTECWLKRIAWQSPDIHTLCGAHTLEFAANPEPFYECLRRWRDSAAVGAVTSA